jgi:hypothetical protein
MASPSWEAKLGPLPPDPSLKPVDRPDRTLLVHAKAPIIHTQKPEKLLAKIILASSNR